jgi:hypothetical protein
MRIEWRCSNCDEERFGVYCDACFGSYAIQIATHVREGLEDDVIDPLEMLTRLQAMPVYAARREPLTLEFVTRQMRLLTRDTTRIARDAIKANAAKLAHDVMTHGDTKDKTALLKGVQVLGDVVEHKGSIVTTHVVELHDGPPPRRSE